MQAVEAVGDIHYCNCWFRHGVSLRAAFNTSVLCILPVCPEKAPDTYEVCMTSGKVCVKRLDQVVYALRLVICAVPLSNSETCAIDDVAVIDTVHGVRGSQKCVFIEHGT